MAEDINKPLAPAPRKPAAPKTEPAERPLFFMIQGSDFGRAIKAAKGRTNSVVSQIRTALGGSDTKP